MRHALFVAFHYPPEASSSGVLRTLKYTQYLGERGWRVTVLTVKPSAFSIVDQTLEEQIPTHVRVVRTRYLNVKRHLAVFGRYPAIAAVPDVWSGWWPWAVVAGRRILRDDPVDVVYSTSPHATAHLIAGHLARAGGLPWVVDFRDPWYEVPPEADTPWIVHWFAKRLEARVVAQAARVVATTDQLRQELSDRYSHMPDQKFLTIMNGYDENDFRGLKIQRSRRGEKLTLLHTGGLNASFRDPRPLLRAIARAANSGEVDPGRIEVRLIGGGSFAESREIATCVAETGLTESVRILPRMSYDRVLDELAAADVAVLLQASPDTASLVPAKLFEYLRAKKPVLALVGEGASKELVLSLGAGWAIEPSAQADLGQVMSQIYTRWTADTLAEVTASESSIRRFDRKNLTAELGRVFDTLLQDRPT